jgi:hypothetical protein
VIRDLSKRYADALNAGRIVISLPTRTRKRLWFALRAYDDMWQEGWNEYTSHIDETASTLCEEYGQDKLTAYGEEGRIEVDLEGFVMKEWPGRVMDALEVFFAELPADKRGAFQSKVNRVLMEERQPWQLAEGLFFKVDSEFLAAEVRRRVEELMKAHGFAGALDEFSKARSDLSAGESKDAITKSCHSFESAMKTTLEVKGVNASVLIQRLVERGYLDDLPEEIREPFAKTVLMALPFIGNRLGRHGQGAEIVEVPAHYAELAVNLAGALIVLVIRRHVELQAQQPSVVTAEESDFVRLEQPDLLPTQPSDFVRRGTADDDIPF